MLHLCCVSTKSIETAIHTDILWLVETAEHAHLREFGHTGQQYELQGGIGSLEGRIKTFQGLTVCRFLWCIEGIENGFVILVYQNHGTTTSLLISSFKYTLEAVTNS